MIVLNVPILYFTEFNGSIEARTVKSMLRTCERVSTRAEQRTFTTTTFNNNLIEAVNDTSLLRERHFIFYTRF